MNEPDPKPTAAGRSFFIGLALLTALGGALRFAGLGSRDFWFDESCTFIYVHDLFDWPEDSSLLVENNYFQGVDTPHEIDTGEGSVRALEANGNTYDNTTGDTDTSGSAFDPPYDYSLESPEAAKSAIEASAGPQ